MRGKYMLLVIAALLAGLTFHLSPAPVARANPGVLYVKPSVSGSGNCSNWANACTLQTALTNASSGDEIWVAKGTYKPGITRVSTFQLKNDVALYGGFAGDETSRDQRNWEANVTTLSGDIGTVGDASDNCYTVVFADGTNNAAVLDGFTITDGNANGSDGLGWSEAFGGGMYNLLAHPTVYNCIFRNNLSIWDGAGMYNNNSNPTLTNVMFYNNATAVDRVGGGMANFRSSPTLINCVFRDNSAESGAGLNNHAYSSPTLTNCSFSGNSATYGSGGISNTTESNPTLTNCILWGNTSPTGAQIWNDASSSPTIAHSLVQGGYIGTGNISADPQFVDAAGGDLHLRPYSPAINAGDNTAVAGITTDLDGNPRIADGSLDMGAYENQNPNHAPVLDNSGSPALDAINEDDTSNNGMLVSALIARLGGSGLTDPDPSAVEGMAVIGVDDTNGTWQYSTNGGGIWTDFGTVSDNSAVVLADGANERVRFRPNTNWNGTVAVGLTFRAWDRADGAASGTSGVDVSTNGGATPYSVASETASITVRVAADLVVSKQAKPASVVPGRDTITYTVVVTNPGPSTITGATLTDTLPAALNSPTWSCVTVGGATCGGGGSGDINDTLSLLENSVVTWTITGTVKSSATSLVNTASVNNPAYEINPGDNSASVNTALTPESDLSISKSSQRAGLAGTPITYTIVVSNAGPSDAYGATVSDTVPAGVSGFTWSCITSGGATCGVSGSGDINDTVNVPVGGVVTYTVNGTVTPNEPIVNTASVTAPAGATDPVTDNNQAVDHSSSRIFLPLILKGFVSAPDLVVDDLIATSTAVTVTIRNAGTAAVTDEFWVDVYFDPSETPSLNHPWDTIASHGVVWGVTTAIPVGGSLVMTTDASDPYYVPEYSSTPPLPVGAEVWALVDSVDYSTTYGAVQESDESNNLYGPVTSTAATGEAAPVFKQSQPASREGLPAR